MLKTLRKLIPEDSVLRLAYSWSKAIAAKIKYGNPSKDLVVIGVTGTDGKTTTTHFTAELFELLGLKVAMASTEEIWMAGERRNNTTKRTTLSPFVTQKFLTEAKQKNCDLVIIEVSSHALAQGRVFGIEFNGAIVTNISQEHGNYHKDLEEYAATKAKLFQLVHDSKKENKCVIINKQMDFYDLFCPSSPPDKGDLGGLKKTNVTKMYNYGIDCEADVIASTLEEQAQSTGFVLNNPKENQKEKSLYTHLNVAGAYNVYNILASSCLAQHFGFSLEKIAEQIPKISPVQGRLEEVRNLPKQAARVLIDFAVTPGALEKVLKSVQETTEGKIVLVFGATGGNHDHDKRYLMGEVSSRLADFVVVTEDETYGEDNEKIMQDIEEGFRENFVSFKKIADRKEAIEFALENTKQGDCVLITGMGAFTSRFNGVEEIEWSDTQCVQDFFDNQAQTQ